MADQREPDVGRRLRELRRRKGLSQRALARACEMSANAVGLIERGECSPSVSTLHRLAIALGVPITDLLTEDDERTVVLRRQADRSPVSHGPVTMENLAEGLAGPGIEIFLVTLEPGAGVDGETIVHMGEEFVFCLEGEIEYHVSGRVYRLEAGDSLIFLAHHPHCWCNPGDHVARLLLVLHAADEPNTRWRQHLYL